MFQNFRTIAFTKRDEMAEIVLNNPPANIMTQEMMQEINTVLVELIKDDFLHLLVFRAEGKHFSAGADVAEHTREKCPEMIPEFMKVFHYLNRLSCITIAVVQGTALGGGCELAVFCDMAVASDKAKFGQPEVSVGVFPPVSVVIFPHLTGRNRALELLLSGDVISAAEAERIGLINRVFPEETFREKADEFIARFMGKSSAVLKLIKKVVDRGLYADVTWSMRDAEKIYLEELMATRDASEGIQAFLDKRKPVWRGR